MHTEILSFRRIPDILHIMIKAIFFDIDGTLVSFKTHTVLPTTVAALEELRRRGIKIFICTGRHKLLIDRVDTRLFDGIVSMNGQCVSIGGETIFANAIAPSDIRNAVSFAERNNIATIYESIDFIRMDRVTPLAMQGAELLALPLPQTEPVDDMHEFPVLQLIFFGNADDEARLLRLMPSCEATRWTPLLCDVIARGGGKHIGIQHVLDYYGYSVDECMAFGDGENDISMLKYVGIGVAMGNAHDEVKAAADHITTTADNDGICCALRYFGLL